MIASRYPSPTRTPVPSAARPVRVVIAARLAIWRDALQATLTAAGGFAVVGQAGDGDEAIQRVHEHCPDVLVLDLDVPPAGGLDVLRRLRDSNAGVQAVVFADEASRAEVVPVLRLGARGVLMRNVLVSVFFDCVRAVAQGHFWIGNEYSRDMLEAVHRVRASRRPSQQRR
jgi:DNA-binding NarL/FixJ family response regulator